MAYTSACIHANRAGEVTTRIQRSGTREAAWFGVTYMYTCMCTHHIKVTVTQRIITLTLIRELRNSITIPRLPQASIVDRKARLIKTLKLERLMYDLFMNTAMRVAIISPAVLSVDKPVC